VTLLTDSDTRRVVRDVTNLAPCPNARCAYVADNNTIIPQLICPETVIVTAATLFQHRCNGDEHCNIATKDGMAWYNRV